VGASKAKKPAADKARELPEAVLPGGLNDSDATQPEANYQAGGSALSAVLDAARAGESALVRYDAARRALAEARTVDEVKTIRNKAAAMAEYARRAKDTALIDDATAIKLDAERRLGEMINEQKETVGLATGAAGIGRSASAVPEKYRTQPPTLAEAGIGKKLSAHAQKLAALAPAEFEARKAAAKKEARASVESPRAERFAAKKERRAEREAELGKRQAALPDKRYGVIYADPAWKFKVYAETASGMNRCADNHYPTMTLDAIKAVDVPSISADDCVLFLWTTVPHLPQALEVMAAWDFTYVSAFGWVKNKAGTGYWIRNNLELLLIGKRGKIPCPAPGDQFDSVIEAPVGRHSAKPLVFRSMIETMFPSLPKIEMFARGAPIDGWHRHGNETTT